MADNRRVEAIDDISSGNKREQAWKMAQQFQQMKFQQQQQNNSTTQDETSNRKYSLVDRSVQTEQEINPESFDEEAGSFGGSFNAGSTITSSQKSETDTGGGSGSGDRREGSSYAPVKAESLKVEKLPKGKIENISINLFGDDEFKK